jgi:hypothetical protein
VPFIGIGLSILKPGRRYPSILARYGPDYAGTNRADSFAWPASIRSGYLPASQPDFDVSRRLADAPCHRRRQTRRCPHRPG